ncbi:nuclear transport factor 2 family protein [Baekduia soli]|uniref:Nuclear transport factor 2 family protein n=1 Tax=Baekduia soli TaxID=496014 RepID=A0A5B8UCI7_9ACTN|nr:nuclear transport factor 2 family protein [Baekduia soli]QEC50568.1 nuclear transport factor 2 family protein [Baekduia soli]
MSGLGPAGMDPTQLLLAHAEIRQLPLRYAYAQDFRDAELLLSLWAEVDEPAEYPDIDLHTVRREHERWFRKGPTVHFVGNHLIELDDAEHAHGTVYCWAQLDFGEEFVDQSILYQDRYVRQDGRWLFHHRRHLLWFGQARAENPIAQAGEDWPHSHTGRGVLPGELRRDGG